MQRLKCLERYVDTDLGVTNVPSLFLASSVGSKLMKSPDSVSELFRDPFASSLCHFRWGCSASSRDFFDPPLGMTDEPSSSIDEFILAVRGSEHYEHRSLPLII